MTLLLSLLVGTANAATIEVPGDYNTLSEAVENAATGDTIRLPSGYTTVSETIYIDKDLTITSDHPPDEVLDDDQVDNAYISVDFNFVPTDPFWQGAFVVDPDVEFTLSNVMIKGPEWACADGIDNDGNTLIDANNDPGCGYFALAVDTATGEIPPLSPDARIITALSGSTLNLESVWFQGFGYAEEGGAIWAQFATVNIDNSIIAYNETVQVATPNWWFEEGEGAIYLDGCVASFTGNRFIHNRGRRGGAVYAKGGTDLVVHDNVFVENQATDGGAFYLEGALFTATNNVFFQNAANLLPDPTEFWMQHEGGAIFAEDSIVDIHNNVFHNNFTLDIGGSIFVRRNATGDGQTDVQVFQNTFLGNSSPGGGSVFLDDTEFDAWNNIHYFEAGGVFGASDWPSPAAPLVTYSDFFAALPEFTADLAIYALPTTSNLFVNPDLVDASVGETEFWETQVYYPTPTSPVIDAGDPGVLDVGGTTSDMGAYGGPDALVADADGDGWEDIYDCDDSDPTVYPTAPEPCDDIDNDCNGIPDDNESVWYEDKDLDGYGDITTEGIDACPGDPLAPIPGGGVWVQNNGDCDDSDNRVNPGLSEFCDGLDNDCDGAIDEDIPTKPQYPDTDEDGFGTDADPNAVLELACPPDGYSPFPGDCDDDDDQAYPLITPAVLVHEPLSGRTPEESEFDRDPSFVADGIDQDCDGGDLCYSDRDGDSFGAASVAGTPPDLTADDDLICSNLSSATAANTGDCNDANAGAYPGADEVVGDGIDQDCDGVDLCYRDRDGDGVGGEQLALDDDLDCDNGSLPTAGTTGDCDDDDPQRGPGNTEICDGIDNNCDGVVDEVTGPDAETFFEDLDDDGYGNIAVRTEVCPQADGSSPEGYASEAGDCDDEQVDVNPDAPEKCDGVDNDCDGLVDDEDRAPRDGEALPEQEDRIFGEITWYLDADADGYGGEDITLVSCNEPSDGGPWVRSGGVLDCDDNNPDVAPGTCSQGGCFGCASGAVGPKKGAPLVLMMLALAGLRRRRDVA